MKLFYSPGACSLSPHIVLCELGLPFTLEKVDLRTKQFSGGDFTKVNRKGSVPALLLDDGQLLTEGAVINQYLADLKPEAHLLPPVGQFARYRAQEWLNYVSTELHKGFSPLFGLKAMGLDEASTAKLRQLSIDSLKRKYSFVAEHLNTTPYLCGSEFSVPDAYLFTVTRWARAFEIRIEEWPSVAAFMNRMLQRPGVMKALEAEGLRR